MKKSIFVSLLLMLALVLVACGSPDEPGTAANTPVPAEPTDAPAEPTAVPEEPTAEPEDTNDDEEMMDGVRICQVTDAGGIDDRSFNASAWTGAQRAADEFGGEAKFLESQQQTDYERNINAFLEDDCSLIVTVGFLLGDATAAAADSNPDQKFSIVDFAYDPAKDNVLGLLFATDQGAFLAGYAAAAETETGIVGTFGGIQIPPVTDFMDGFAMGVMQYNEDNGTDVQVLGWDAAAQTGLFAGNFESTDDGRALGESLMDEGADIIMPVAGPVGLGTAAAAQERGGVQIIGVDTDWTVSASEYADIIFTSVLKNIDVAVYAAAETVQNDAFSGGAYLGTLANGGVGVSMANLGDMEDALMGVMDGIIAGDIQTRPSGEMMEGDEDALNTDDGEEEAEMEPANVCQVTDAGGIDDRSFNAKAWEGAQAGAEITGGEAQFLESQQQTDYERNINAFLEEDCDLIVTVGFLLGDATGLAADSNPDQKFAIVDFAYDPAKDNVLGLLFSTDQAAFVAGYAAASQTQTGVVGTFGGLQIPPVTVFMDGFALGVQHYNEENGTDVAVIGWDPAEQTGLFAGNFESTDDGRSLGESLMDEGADIIMPVAGPVGLGTAAAAQERGDVWIVGVDTDWTITSSEYADIILTSVLKNMDVSVRDAAIAVSDGSYSGGATFGTLENGGVGIAMDKLGDMEAELAAITDMIIAGDIATSP